MSNPTRAEAVRIVLDAAFQFDDSGPGVVRPFASMLKEGVDGWNMNEFADRELKSNVLYLITEAVRLGADDLWKSLERSYPDDDDLAISAAIDGERSDREAAVTRLFESVPPLSFSADPLVVIVKLPSDSPAFWEERMCAEITELFEHTGWSVQVRVERKVTP